MRKVIFLFLLFSVITVFKGYTQQNTLKGSITDTLNKQNLSNAVISILQAKDSVLVKFTRTNTQGDFTITNLPSGNFLIMVSYPSYADYVDRITLASNKETHLGSLPLITKAKLLEEVIVRQRIGAIRVKGDTTEYKADSFHVSANADVQELLRKMPGIQVNSKGEITAQGERVQKVLVDGEEFFSDDPAVVTKNLRADAVDKIQSFDKKSDQAVFSGIDDGQKIKTLNIQLKEDKKKGYFGKVELGSDFDRYRYGKVLANAFKGKRKLSGYLTTDNTKFESLNWDENRNYGGDPNTTTTFGDDGGISISSSGDEFSWGRGFPTSSTGGLHFSDKWDKDTHNSNNTYQYNNLQVTGITNSNTQNILPDTSFTNATSQDQINNKKRHKLTSIYEWQIDSSSSLKATVRVSNIKSYNKSNYLGQSISEDNKIINESNRTTTNDGDNSLLNTNLFWRKKFAKKGRTISINSELNFNNRSEDGFLLATNNFYNTNGLLIKQDNIDQKKVNKQITSNINTLATYTEPLWKNTFLVLNYRFGVNTNDAERNTFSKNNGGKYVTLLDTLSNHFIFNTTDQLGSFNVRYNVKKVNFALGSGFGTAVYRMTDIRKDLAREVRFNNFVPSLTFNYTPKQQRRATFSYNGNTRNPSLQQIQPIVDNIDPLYIVVGNPNLQQSFTHSLNFRASDYKVLKSRNISFDVNYSNTERAISESSRVDSLGRRISQAINVDGNYNISANVNYGINVIQSLNINLNAGPRKSRNVNVINGINNITDNSSISIGLNSGYWSDKWINFWINVNANYNSSISSIRPEVKTQYWSYNTYANLQFKFKKQKLYIDMSVEANIYQKTAAFANQLDVYILSPSIRKVLSKDDKWEAKFYVNDLLNQNQGINRNISSNYISETTSQTIQRYFMLSLIYNFTKNGKPSNMGF